MINISSINGYFPTILKSHKIIPIKKKLEIQASCINFCIYQMSGDFFNRVEIFPLSIIFHHIVNLTFSKKIHYGNYPVSLWDIHYSFVGEATSCWEQLWSQQCIWMCWYFCSFNQDGIVYIRESTLDWLTNFLKDLQEYVSISCNYKTIDPGWLTAHFIG